jgi:polyhydroxyalkanoate synthesis regulator phasin
MAEKNRDLFTESLHAGVGFALRTRDAIEDFAKQMSQQYKLSEEEGRKFADRMVKETEESRTELDEAIEKRVNAYFEKAGVVRKDDIDAIAKKIDALEKKIGK